MLKPQLQKFASLVAAGQTYRAAAIACGISEATAKQVGSRWMKRKDVIEYVQDLCGEQRSRRLTDSEKILSEIEKLAFDVKSKCSTRLRALELLAKATGSFAVEKETSKTPEVCVKLEYVPVEKPVPLEP